MASLTYAGVTIGLGGLLATERYERHPLVEGANYTGRRHVLTVRGYVNPRSVSAQTILNNFGQQDPTQVNVVGGQPPPLTEVAIRFLLEQPRQQLTYVSGNTVVLSVPSPGTPVDAANGPFPKVVRMTPVLGEFKTWLIDFTVEMVLNDCPPFPANTLVTFGALANRAVTSNVWTMSQTTNADGLTVRETEGRTTFRTDVLAAGGFPGITPDQLSPFFFPPVPNNCRREVTHRKQAETNDAMQWKIRDVELMNNVRAQGVTRVALKHRARIVTVDRYQAAREAAEGFLDFAGDALIDITKVGEQIGAILTFETPAIAAGAGWAMKGMARMSRSERSIIPTVEISVTVGVWGRRDCSTKTLERFALQLANARLTFSLSFGARLLAGQTIELEEDCSEERHVRLSATMRSSISGYAFLLAGLNGGLADVGSFFPAADGTVLPGGNGLVAQTLPGVSLPNDNGTRGSLLDTVQASPLTKPCAGVPSPTQTPPAITSPVIGPDPA